MVRSGRLGGLSLLAAVSLVPAARAFELPCTHEDALSETAAEFLLSSESLTAASLLYRARSFGFDGVAVQAHESASDDALIAWLKAQSERADGPLSCGEAHSESRRLVVVSARGGQLSLRQGKLVGRLAPGFRAPHLVLEDDDGNARRVDVKLEELQQGVILPEELSVKRVQLVADGPSGPRPVAELVLSRQAARPQAPPSNELASVAPRARSRDSLFARLSAFRRGEGAGGLRQNQLLDASAQRHAERVCELGKVAHRFGQGDDPETRLREEHIEARGVGEAVARASSADAALNAVFDSPSHRMAVTQRNFTDAGLGQAFDSKGHTCLVVLLASWPRRTP